MSNNKNILPYLDDICIQSEYIALALQRMTYEEFLNDPIYNGAVTRFIEIIGEAVKHVPDEIRIRYPDVAWRQIAEMGDKLIHGYSEVNLAYVWEVANKMVPPLHEYVIHIISELETE